MNAMALQLLISLGGIAVMVAFCAALFGRAETPLANTDAAATRLAGDIPGFRAGHTALSRDGRAALIENARDGAVYLVLKRGDGLVTRKLARGTALSRDGDRLALMLHEFTLKTAELELADAAFWETRLKGTAA